MSIPGLTDWLDTPQGRYIRGWEEMRVGRLVSDVFGYNAVQIGLPEIDFLAENRMPHKFTAGPSGPVTVRCDGSELPFASGEIDLVVLAHSLEFHEDPHRLIREVERVLIPEGQLVILGFNPFSLWGLRHRLPRCPQGFPWNGRYIGVPRLKDWLSLLAFDIERGHFGRYAPPFSNEQWLKRCGWMEPAGDRWWPTAGGVYVLRAVKRVHGMRLVGPLWKDAARLARAARLVPAGRTTLSPRMATPGTAVSADNAAPPQRSAAPEPT